MSASKKIYKIYFDGMLLRAMGKTSSFVESVLGLDFKTAILKLNKKYKHIQITKVNGKEYDPINPPE